VTTAIAYPENTETAKAARAKIMRIQAECSMLDDTHRMDESPPLKHWLSNGVYAREICLPADSVVVGKIHRHEHLNIISKGTVTVFTEFGEETLNAGDSFISMPGTKRVVYTHPESEAIWTTIHANPDNEKDIEKLEDRYTAIHYAELGMDVDLLEDAA
jgi:quercetin dioxygenase-like cupin family protein